MISSRSIIFITLEKKANTTKRIEQSHEYELTSNRGIAAVGRARTEGEEAKNLEKRLLIPLEID